MTRLRVTVAVAVLDRPDALARCLDALAAGTSLPGEVLVVDQGSDHRVSALIEERRGALPGLRLVEQARRGLSASRNLAAEHAVGEVLAVTDDDCMPERRWVEALANAFAADEELAAITGPMLPLGPAAADAVAVSSRTSTERREFRGRALPWAVGTGGNTAVRRSWLERLGGYDERLGAGTPAGAGEDLDLFRRLLAAGGRILYDPEAVCRHERKTPAERSARRGSYGRGAGAALGIWVREGDPWALVTTARWLGLRAGLLARSGSRKAAVDELRVLAGTARGLRYGLALPAWGRHR